ncbi:unnamed protein product [Alternaria burnsii]|nr:unnamed protein product [Alternaria burnsii]
MPGDTTKELELSHLDQQPHIRVYGRYYIIFPFPDITYAHAAKEALHTGFKEVLRRFPYLAGTVDIPDPSTQLLRVRYPDPIDLEAEARRVFTVSYDDAQHDYDALAEDAFEPGELPATIFCPNELKYHAGLGSDPYAERMTSLQKGPVPVFATQATFIPGGLVLSAWFYHAVLDGTGNARIQKIWSDAVRALHPQASKPVLRAIIKEWNDIPDPSSARSALATLVQEAGVADSFADHSGNPLLAKRYELRKGPDEGLQKVITNMFRFSSPALQKLRSQLSTKTGRNISIFTALSAIIWGNIVHARSALLAASDNKQSTLAVVVDLRKYLPIPFSSPDYLGNLVLSALPTLDLENAVPDRVTSLREEALHAPDSFFPAMTVPADQQSFCLENLAVKITDALHAVDAAWAITQINSVLTNPTEAQQSLLKFPKGPDLYITSWQRMGADREWYIPGTSTPNATAIRRAAWVSEGGIVVLPREEDKEGQEGEPYEVMLSLTQADMERFEYGLQSAGWLTLRRSRLLDRRGRHCSLTSVGEHSMIHVMT